MEKSKALIISIRPEFTEKIFAGIKRWEFRKSIAEDFDRMFIYESAPVSKVVGEVEVADVISGKPDDIWAITKDDAGISEEYFKKYFDRRGMAYAIGIGKTTRWNEPIALADFGKTFPPQSWCYAPEKLVEMAEERKRR